jgi:hypothetical protein
MSNFDIETLNALTRFLRGLTSLTVADGIWVDCDGEVFSSEGDLLGRLIVDQSEEEGTTYSISPGSAGGDQ